MEETAKNNDPLITVRRLAAGCIDWPLAITIGLTVLHFLKGPSFLMSFYLVLFVCFYFVFFECCPLQTTPGKLLTGLKLSNTINECVSFWQASAGRIWQCALICSLFYTSSLVNSLDLLMDWGSFTEIIAICALYGIFGLTGVIVWQLRYASPPVTRVSDRLVSKRIINKIVAKKQFWSIQRFLSFDLSIGQTLLCSLALVSVIVLSYLSASLEHLSDKKLAVAKKVPILYAIKDISEGSVIRAEDIETREMMENRIPCDAIRSADNTIGHFCKYGLYAGQIVSLHDVNPLKESKK